MSFAQIAVELEWFFHPIAKATKSGGGLSEFLAHFGYGVAEAQAGDALDDLANLGEAVDAVRTLISTALATADGDALDIDADEVAQIIVAAKDVYSTIDGIAALLDPFVSHPPPADFPLEVLDHLIDAYLGSRTPPLRAVLEALAVRKTRLLAVTDAGGRDIDYREVRYDFARLGQFISDTGQWGDEVYGWGRSFEQARALQAITLVVESFGGRPYFELLSAAEQNSFVNNVPHLPMLGAAGGTASESIYKIELPLFVAAATLADDDIEVSGKAGVAVVPTGDFNNAADMGLAIAPFVEGQATGTIPITDRLSFSFTATGAATGGAYITVRPSGVAAILGGAASASYSATLAYQKPDASPIIFLGAADGTRIQADGLLASTGGSMDGDLYIAGGVRGLTAVIDPGDDGLLSALIPDPIVVRGGDILVGVRPGRGVYFEAGTSLSIDIPLSIDLNLLKILGLGVKLDWSNDFAIDTTLEGELKIGPLYAYADGIGIRTTVVKRKGLLGENDLEFGFIPPTSYAVALDLAPVEGGGLIELANKEYRGALALKFKAIGFSAFGILNTELPGGQPGFSFVASIFGEFNLALGYGFFLTGLGGVVGINRTIDTNAMRSVLFEGRFDNLLFPADPIANAATILDDMAAIFPSRAGQHVFGPVARIGWGVPTLISIKLGVIIEVGSQVRLLILGGLACELPTPESAIVSLKLSFFGEIDFNAGTISFDATLQGSRILTFSLSGDVAVRTGWASGIEHVVSFGGLHPQFPRPSNLPDLRRITLDFGTNNPKITVSGYTAITLNSLQFGADLQVYAKGPKIWLVGQLAAEGWAYFHALVIFDPFAFTASLGGGIKLLRNGKVACGLGFDITLSGPNRFTIDGRVWVSVFGIDVDFAIKHSWGSSQGLPPVTVDPAQVLHTALQSAKIEAVAAQGGGAVNFTKTEGAVAVLDPVGGARIDQNRLPLGVRISRIGEGTIPGGATADIQLFRGGLAVNPAENVNSDFVHGHYFSTSQTEKLRATAYDRLKSGVVMAVAASDTDAGRAIKTAHGYEIIRIPMVDERETAATPGSGSTTMQTGLFDRVAVSQRFADPVVAREYDLKVPRADKPIAEPVRFTTQQAVETVIRSPATTLPDEAVFGTFAEASNALELESVGLASGSGDLRVGVGATVAGPVPAYFALAA